VKAAPGSSVVDATGGTVTLYTSSDGAQFTATVIASITDSVPDAAPVTDPVADPAPPAA
jgi:hypothetical protein